MNLEGILDKNFETEEIGIDYLNRWILAPKHKFQKNYYLHKFVGDDDIRRGLHDHPWDFTSIIVKGAYQEYVPTNGDVDNWKLTPIYKAPHILKRKAEYIHAVKLVTPVVWTIMITDKVKRDWGFWKDGEFVPHEEAFIRWPYTR